ncbi:MAG: Cell division protein FtsX [Microbacteriaceae bacterium]|nr:Cell division protein FtsX [Microbacteriaceae bacterium]
MSAWASGIVGAVVEAWAELRIHRTRVLLSLIGVAVAVTAITSVVGVGSIAQQALTESSERSSGRPALINLSAYGTSGQVADLAVMDAVFATITERYGIDYSSRSAGSAERVQFIDGVVDVQTQAIDQPYGAMHRVAVEHGAWFAEGDENRLAPALVVNNVFWEKLGSPDLATHPVVTLGGGDPVTAVVVGVLPTAPYEEMPSMMMLYSAWQRTGTVDPAMYGPPQYELWVPPEIGDELKPLVERDLRGAVGEGYDVSVNRQDYLAWGLGDQLLPFKLVIGGVALLVLGLGALGLVNISLVTVRQRIREIGIRRSFGATAGRVFFAVMMESVVATIAAGVVGVGLAILIVQNPWVRAMVGQGVEDLPPFPVEAALVGLAASALVGALAGLLPALVAVRVKVIDAIRY